MHKPPEQVAENTLEHITDLAAKKVEKSTVRLVNQVGTSTTLGTGFFVEKDKNCNEYSRCWKFWYGFRNTDWQRKSSNC